MKRQRVAKHTEGAKPRKLTTRHARPLPPPAFTLEPTGPQPWPSKYTERDFRQTSATVKSIRTGLHELSRRTLGGDTNAAGLLAAVVTDSVAALEQLATKHPDHFRPHTRRKMEWPFLISWHPQRMAFSRSRDTDAERLLTRLEIGKDFDLTVDPKRRWNTHDPFTEVALRLFEYLTRFNEYHIRLELQERERVVFQNDRPRLRPAWFGDHKTELLPSKLARATAPQWWAMAERVLKHYYPHLEQFDRLAKPAKQSLAIDLRTPGRVNARIVDYIKRRFFRLAPR